MPLLLSSRRAAWPLLAVLLTLLVTGCGTSHPLPEYERPLAHADLQTVRTTAYTHTESDHLEYGNHNALGGILHAAGPPIVPAAIPVDSAGEIVNPRLPQAFQPRDEVGDVGGGVYRAAYPVTAVPPGRGTAVASTGLPAGGIYGSAAADWSRWPAGTIFRIIPTGQLYKVDDYGWALSGRNTIDLYMPTTAAMNSWGVRTLPIQVLRWGERNESLRLLTRHQKFRHIRRMVLELEGRQRAAAAMR